MQVTDCKPTDNYTSITFHPDLAKFGMVVSGMACTRAAHTAAMHVLPCPVMAGAGASSTQSQGSAASASQRRSLPMLPLQELEEDAVALMRKRVYDMAGVLGKTCKARLSAARSMPCPACGVGDALFKLLLLAPPSPSAWVI